MYLKDHFVRIENIKAMQALHEANIDHKVIAVFMTSEGIAMQAQDVSCILSSYGLLGTHKLPARKIQALLAAKHIEQEDDSLPCPAAY